MFDQLVHLQSKEGDLVIVNLAKKEIVVAIINTFGFTSILHGKDYLKESCFNFDDIINAGVLEQTGNLAVFWIDT